MPVQMNSPFVIGRIWLCVIPAITFASFNSARADESGATCQSPGWDMSREIATFRGTAASLSASNTANDLRTIDVGSLYALKLRPQADVQFLQPPEKASRAQTPLAGLVRFTVTSSGKYRITLDAALWIDVVSPTGILPSSAFNGWHACSLFRKSVEYTFQAGQMFVLQFSGAATELVRMAIEPKEETSK